ncbi:hypothetical protein TRFO_16406 [Tritrichomonas foetus]|uniref:CLASP N-terminal domain-containing protein n=1 Tax=Tritrichomonas foetus TaxID=1144522 RepID=A0A1J4KR67_9EUKA|nr:hypothetical protein TRFO_16406 [Tritrichomonas foetus]|eukprot:OHT13424.1 hypothetical protein TRFO_16406 [Tritrichomonas foetus]
MNSPKSPIEKFNLSALEQEFESPLDKHNPCEVESSQEAKEEFEKLTIDLDAKSPWKTRNEAMNHILELLKGGIQYYPGGDLKAFAPYLAAALSDLRPVLIKTAALVVAAEAQILEDDFIPSIDPIFPCLLKQLTSNNIAIAHSCHLALLNIAKHCMNRRVARLFLSNYNSPTPAYRQLSVECAHIIIETWPSQLTSLLSKETSSVIVALAEDPIETIQNIALAATKVNRSASPKRSTKKVNSTLPFTPALTCKSNPKQTTPRKSPSGASGSPTNAPASSPSVSSKSPKNTAASPMKQNLTPRRASPSRDNADVTTISAESVITDFMPPSNTIEAKAFKIHLDKLISLGDLSVLEMQPDNVVSSVLFAMREFPNYNEWSNAIEILFESFGEMLDHSLIDIMSIFGFNSEIVDFAVNRVGAQTLAEMFTTGKKPRITDTFNFFVSIFRDEKYSIEVTDQIGNLIQSLIKQNKHNENVKYLENAVKEAVVDIPAILEIIVIKLSNCDKWQGDLENLLNSYDETKQSARTIEKRLETTIPDLISHGTEAQRTTCIAFIQAAASKLKKVSFKCAFEPLVAVLLEDNCNFYEKGVSCLAKSMNDIRTLSKAIVLLDHSEASVPVVLDALLKFSIDAPPQKILAAHKTLVKKLSRFLVYEDTHIRHATIGIFAECRKKIPKEFTWQMKKNFTPIQRRLVELKAGKYRGNKTSTY